MKYIGTSVMKTADVDKIIFINISKALVSVFITFRHSNA